MQVLSNEIQTSLFLPILFHDPGCSSCSVVYLLRSVDAPPGFGRPSDNAFVVLGPSSNTLKRSDPPSPSISVHQPVQYRLTEHICRLWIFFSSTVADYRELRARADGSVH